MSHATRRVPFAAKVDALDAKVGGYQELMVLCDLPNRSIIANAADHAAMSGVLRELPDSLDQFSFCQEQSSLHEFGRSADGQRFYCTIIWADAATFQVRRTH